MNKVTGTIITIINFTSVIIASFLLAHKFGGEVGWAVGLIAYALLPIVTVKK